jgi:hypothetical protein
MIIQDFFFLADYGTTTRTFFIVLFICMQNLSEIILFIVSYICNRFIYMQQEQQHNNCFIQYCVTLHYIWSYIGLENIYIQQQQVSAIFFFNSLLFFLYEWFIPYQKNMIDSCCCFLFFFIFLKLFYVYMIDS